MGRYTILKARKELGLPAPSCRECRWCVRVGPPDAGIDRCYRPGLPLKSYYKNGHWDWCLFEREGDCGADGKHFEPWRWMPRHEGFLFAIWAFLSLVLSINLVFGVYSIGRGNPWGIINLLLCVGQILVWPPHFPIKRVIAWLTKKL